MPVIHTNILEIPASDLKGPLYITLALQGML
jgi:hypothetical protein